MTTETQANAETAQPETTTEPQTQTTETSSTSTDLGASEQTQQETTATDLGAEEETPKEETPALPEYFGAPEGEASYEPFELPDGYAADEELSSLVSPIGKKLGLNQKGMQELVNLKPKMDKIALERWQGHLTELKAQAQADPEIGGAKYAPAIAAGKGVISKFGTPAFRTMLNHYGIGAHPEMIRFLGKIAKATGETPAPGGEGGSGGTVERPLHEILYDADRK